MQRMCSTCREVKDESEFYYREKTNYYNSYCRECERIFRKEYMRAYREQKPQYVEKNRAKMRERMREERSETK